MIHSKHVLHDRVDALTLNAIINLNRWSEWACSQLIMFFYHQASSMMSNPAFQEM